VTAALARRDVLATRQSVLRSTVESVTQTQARYSRSEIRLTRQIDVAALRREIDDLARERRELDTAIQEHNWSSDLVEDSASRLAGQRRAPGRQLPDSCTSRHARGARRGSTPLRTVTPSTEHR
jgi:hypothetical protein